MTDTETAYLAEESKNGIILRDNPRINEITDILRRMIINNIEFTNNNSNITTINFHIIPLEKNTQKDKIKHSKKNSHISHLPKYYKFKEKDKNKDSDGQECSICLNRIKDGDFVRKLPKCGHLFHKKCVDKWFKKDKERMSCPVCRSKHGINYYLPSNLK